MRFLRKRKSKFLILLLTMVIFVILYSCKKDEAPDNPYDKIDQSINTPPVIEPDPNTIVGLQKNIFFPKCANPGCHDGTFEPDYRTIESTFSTLVYQRVNKITLDSVKFFSERVIPNNTPDSWLIERLTTQTSEYMPSNGVRLSSSDIEHIKNWITSGCPDANGTMPLKPNLQPNIIGYIAVDSVTNSRLDTNRVNGYPLNPFIAFAGSTIRILFLATDTADGTNGTDPSEYNVKEIHFSLVKNDFSGALVVASTFYLSQYEAWLVDVPIKWPAGTTIYFRIYVNDGDHPGINSEFPRNASIDYYKTLYSFYVQ